MTKSSFALCLILASWSEAAQASERAAALYDSFAVMCNIEPLDFARTDAKAAAMKLPVIMDKNIPGDVPANYVHVKSWLLPLKTGPHEFVIAEGNGPKGHVLSCGISAPDVDADDFKAELIKDTKLGEPQNDAVSPDGKEHMTNWLYGPDHDEHLVFIDHIPEHKPKGIMLTLIQESAPR